MKSKKIIQTTLLMLFLGTGYANAQFFDKLQKKVEQKVENKVIDKTAGKAEKETGKTMDKVLEPKKSKKNKKDKNQKNTTSNNTSEKSSSFKSSYDFSYQYQLTVKTKEGDMVMDYFIQPNQNDYLGSKINTGGMDMFMILENNQSYVFMDINGMKMAQSTNMGGNEFANEEFHIADYKITEIPGKTILGYSCKGLQMEDENYISKIYYTNNAPVSMTDISNQQIPEAAKKYFTGNSLMMYMEITDKKNKGKKNISGTMECTLIQENKFSFSTEGYSKYGF